MMDHNGKELPQMGEDRYVEKELDRQGKVQEEIRKMLMTQGECIGKNETKIKLLSIVTGILASIGAALLGIKKIW